jgi:hypothetical protein
MHDHACIRFTIANIEGLACTHMIISVADAGSEDAAENCHRHMPTQSNRTCGAVTTISTPHSASEFYSACDGATSATNQSAPMVLSLDDFFQSSKEVITSLTSLLKLTERQPVQQALHSLMQVIELEVAKMDVDQLAQLERSVDQAMQTQLGA